MRYTKFTVAVAAAGAGVICLAPAAAAEENAPEPGTATVPGAVGLEPCFRVRGIIPCVRVGSVRGIIPCVRVRSNRGIIPCVRVGVPVVPEARIVEIDPCFRVGAGGVKPNISLGDATPPEPVRASGESAAVS